MRKKVKRSGEKSIFVILGTLLIMFFIAILVRGLNISDPSIYPDSQVINQVVIENQLLKGFPEIKVQKNNIWIPLEMAKQYIDPTLYFDSKNQLVTITLSNEIFRLKINDIEGKRNNEPFTFTIPAIIEKGTVYIPISDLKEIYNLELLYSDKTQILVVEFLGQSHKLGKIKKSGVDLKQGTYFFSTTIAELKKDEQVTLYEVKRDWVKVRTQQGLVGYLSAKSIYEITQKPAAMRRIQSSQQKAALKQKKVLLTWEYVDKKNPDIEIIPAMQGLNVVSPTWFRLIDSNGTLSNSASKEYIAWAKKRGYQVWPLVQSFNPDITTKILNDTLLREKVQKQILWFTRMYDVEGINIDFENIYLKDKDQFTQFIRELYTLSNAEGIVLSIDVTPHSSSANWSLCYDRKALGKVTDYIMLMTYDEHWASSTKSGSVASIGWVKQKLNMLLKEVPAQKVVLGVPFYTRIWIEKPNGTLHSKALAMKEVDEYIKKYKLTPTWNQQAGQYYVQWNEGGTTYKIWIEDARSLSLKVGLVKQYHLAGAAAWRRGFEDLEIWNIMNSIFSK